MRIAAIAACLLAASVLPVHSARAAERPRFPPTRDVAVSYRATADGLGGGAQTVTIAFSAALQKLRADAEPGGMIVDVRGKSVVLVMTQQRMAVRLPAGREIDRVLSFGGPTGGAGDGTATATRIGPGRVAGIACTNWRLASRDGDGTVCVTDDGVPLRGEGKDAKGKTGNFEAISVDYSPLAAARFEVPPGFQQMDMSAMLRSGHRP